MYFSPRKKYCQNQTKLRVISQNSSFSPPPHSKCAKKSTATRQVGHVCLAPAGGPKAKDGDHVSA